MTFDQLRVFVAVAERQHMTRAAAALGLAQSAVSFHIANLEAQNNVKLFHRVGRRVELTADGVLFLAEAQAVLARAGGAQRLLAELGGLQRGMLAVQASQTIAGYWLPRHLVAFRRAYPDIVITLTIGNTAQVADAIHAGAAELGFVEGLVHDPVLRNAPVARDQLVIVVAPDHAWARSGEISPTQLSEADWVLRERGSGTRSIFESALEGFGVAPGALRVALELPSNEAVRAAVEAGLGATALSSSIVAPSLEAGLLRKVGPTLPERSFCALLHSERTSSRAAAAFLALFGLKPI
jgi:DNA-binding transcriptional LysR family regulator